MSSLPRRIGKYELIELVGRGGMAEVWKALDTQLDRHVAIKFLHADLRTDPTFMTRFVREAQAIAALHHPNIVKIHDFQITSAPGLDGSLAFMVMNFIEGPMLSEYLARTSRTGKYPPAANIVHLFTSIGRAIDYAHQRGMVHRDIKPTNILLEERNILRHPMGEPILTDFGIVKLMGASGSTLSGVILGTPNYISPEQAQGQPGNERSDIYSFGVILYEICTGVRPFQGDSAVAIIMQHIGATPPLPHFINPSLPPTVSEVILRSLAKAPNERFPDASSMTSALSKAFNLTPIAGSSGDPNTADTMKVTGYTSSEPQSVKPIASSTQSPPITSYQTPTSRPPRNVRGNGQFEPHTPITEPGNFSDEVLIQNDGQNLPTHILPSSEVEALSQFAHQPPLTPVFKESDQNIQSTRRQSSSPVHPASLSSPKKRRRALFVTLTLSLIMVLLVASLSTIYFYAHNKPPSPTPIENLSVGSATFHSSVMENGNTNQGVNDELRITLRNIPAPVPGKSYYAWLLSDKGTTSVQAILLGKLTAIDGNVDFPYLHNQQDTDLLSNTSRFVITEENDSTKFSSDTSAWRYYAEIPQTPNTSVNPSSVLQDLRLLLSDDPSTKLKGGMAFGFNRSAQQVRALVGSASKAWDNKDASSIHNEIVHTLDYLDGAEFVQKDLPFGQNPLINRTLVEAPLLEVSQGQTPAGYFSRISTNLQDLIGDPGVTSTMVTLANQALNAIYNAQSSLDQVRSRARQLVTMTAAQLLQPTVRDTLDYMVAQTNDAYEGQVDTTTNTSSSGINFIVETIQRLPTFDVKPYKS